MSVQKDEGEQPVDEPEAGGLAGLRENNEEEHL
jgi:hypothetical protein